MLKSSGAMAGATMASRLLGLAREMAYASFMGNHWVASAFQLAFAVPNLFRRLLGEGALTAAFIPIFKQKEVKEGEKEMWRSANAVISGLVTATGAITILAVVAISVLLLVYPFKEETEMMLLLLRMMFPYMPLVCLAAVLIGMANARGHFFVPALGRGVAECSHDRQCAPFGTAHGNNLARSNPRARNRGGAGWACSGLLSIAQPST
jgi:putative peptidoglycan lipid II flippase